MATEINMENYREAFMSAELNRFWSTVGRRHERDSLQRPFTPRQPLRHCSVNPLHTFESEEPDVSSPFIPFLTETPSKQYDESEQLFEELEAECVEAVLPGDLLPENSGDRSSVCEVRSEPGDVPGQYQVKGLQPHEHPVVGTYIHPNIVPGFCYHVRKVDSTKQLFRGRALRLVALGRGYGKRITFEGDSHNINDNYFWSDTHPEGYGFAVCLVQKGDKFTLRDANNFPVATAEVDKIQEPHVEVEHKVLETGKVKKRARVALLCRVSYFDADQQEQLLTVRGVAQATKAKGSRTQAAVKKIVDCCVGGERGWTLVAGVDSNCRVSVVSGSKIGDIPTKYTIKGLLPHELPVIGTYVDPNINTGFKYRVRPTDSRRPMFNGAALLLQSVGRGYGKRITFASKNLNNNENYFWSDSNPEGYGFSIQAVSPGDDFRISSTCGEDLGWARVFRADLPQVEESSHVSSEGHVTKRVRVTVTCDVCLHGEEDHTLVVTGTAVVVRRGRVARVMRLEEVALGSQISVLFRHASKSLVFVREAQHA